MSDRSERERRVYDDQAIEREGYESLLGRSYYYYRYLDGLVRRFMAGCEGRKVLEIGSNAWIGYIYEKKIRPKHLLCINISEKELDIGRSLYEDNDVGFSVDFRLMDASNLEVADESFDIVFGGAILHHLELPRAVPEIHRVLSDRGRILFNEPLGVNPVAKIIRRLTPGARTADEKPFGLKDLKLIEREFVCEKFYAQLFSVVSTLVSRRLSLKPENLIDHSTYIVDRGISSLLPFMRPLYREFLIHGVKR